MRFRFLVVLLSAVMTSMAFAQGLPKDDQVLADVKEHLSKKKTWATVELRYKWQLEHDKVYKTQPPDMAKRSFRCETTKTAEGVYTEYAGLAIYTRSGPDSWIFSRLFFFENATKMHGTSAPSQDELFKICYEGLRTNHRTRAWGVVDSRRVTHVDSISFPEELEFKQVSAKKMEFLVELTFDQATRRSGKTGVQKLTGTFKVTAMKKGDQWSMRARRKGEFKELSWNLVPEQTLKRAKSLADVDLDEMYGESKMEMKAPELPSTDTLKAAVQAYYNKGAREFDKLFGNRKSEEVTEVESVRVAEFRKDVDVNPDEFILQVEFIFRSVTGYRNNLKWVRVRRVAQCNFVKTAQGYAVKHGRPVANTEKTLETISADSGVASQKKRAKDIFASGGNMNPTGGSPVTAQSQSSQGQGQGQSEAQSQPAEAAMPTAEEITKAFKITVDHSAKNFAGVLGNDMAKKVVDIESVTPDMRTIQRVDRQSVQLTITIDFTWKRFDNVLMKSRRHYDIKVKESPKGGHFVSGARQRARERELAKVSKDRNRVKQMPLYVEKEGKLVKQKKEPAPRPAPRKPSRKAREAKKIIGGLLGGR